MALSSTTNRVSYTASGSQSVYAYPFKVFSSSHLLVTVRNTNDVETTLALSTDYTVSGVGEASGGNVTLVDSNQAWLDSDGDLIANYVITIRRVVPLTQATDIRNQGSYYPEDIEDQFDKCVMQIQQVDNKAGNAIRLKETDDQTADMTLPVEADRASKFLAFDADGEPIASNGGISDSIPVSSYMETLLDDTTASDAQTTLGISTFAKTLLDDTTASTARDTLGASSGVWPAAQGGTGLSSYTAGDIPYASGATTLSKLGIGTTGKQIVSTGSAPSYEDPIFFKNWIINGNFDFWQRGTSFSSVADNTYTVDRFLYSKTGAAVHTLSRESSILPTLAESGFKSSYALKVDCTTADASIAASDYVALSTRLEGFSWAQLINKTVTLSFWVYATKTGTYSVSFANNGLDRTYIAEYTVSAANTWEKKTITATLNPSGGTENYTNGVGLRIRWVLLSGSGYTTSTIGSWVTGDKRASTNQVNACDSASNDFYLAQVMLNIGAVAAPFSRAGGTIGEELALCQRYYEKSYDVDTALTTFTVDGSECLQAASTGTAETRVRYKTRKRGGEQITTYATASSTTANRIYDATGPGVVTPTVDAIGEAGYRIYWASTDARVYYWHWVCDAEL